MAELSPAIASNAYPQRGTPSLGGPTTGGLTRTFRWPERAGSRYLDMADKSPRKQNKGKKLSTKEKKAKKKAKKDSKKDRPSTIRPG